jgi:hypothetical protein
MLAGRCDVAYPKQFNKRYGEYSDDGEVVHGAYGYRWRRWFDFDQLTTIVAELRRNPNSRRAVLSMWTPNGDLAPIVIGETLVGGLTSRDVPCNTHAYFDLRGGKLNMTVCNRSNDALWGAYGANVVHFSLLQEYIAEQLGVTMGVYRQFSNNLHVYTDKYNEDDLIKIAEESAVSNIYLFDNWGECVPLGSHHPAWADDLRLFLETGRAEQVPFLVDVAAPMYQAWMLRKTDPVAALDVISNQMAISDWRHVSFQWIMRRERKKQDAA